MEEVLLDVKWDDEPAVAGSDEPDEYKVMRFRVPDESGPQAPERVAMLIEREIRIARSMKRRGNWGPFKKLVKEMKETEELWEKKRRTK